jgi:hypothetical protein
MANWLQKLLAPVPPSVKGNLPVTRSSMMQNKLQKMVAIATQVRPSKSLPNAAVVYGIAAAVFLVASLALIISGAWLSGLLVLLPMSCFVGFALHFIKHQ